MTSTHNIPQVPPPPSDKRIIEQKTPINIFTGFLGSGKTTIISDLINQVKNTQKVVYIKNEEGDVEVDTTALAGQGIVSQEMLDGCVCCTLVGPLMNKLDELIKLHQPDRIILESSGTAEPTNLAVTITGNRNVYRDSLVTVIDTLHYDQEPRYNDHYQLQAKVTDLLILNKIEEVKPDQKQKVIEALRSTNSYSPIVESYNGAVSRNLVFGLASKLQIDSHHHAHHHHHHDIESFTIYFENQIEIEKLEPVLDNLPDEIIRVKGLLFTPEPTICNQAYKRRTFTKAVSVPSAKKPFLYFIGQKISRYQEQIQQQLLSTTRG